ncbi:MAG: molybdenum ABC transporter ATP-binding protein [Gammaproteobacteria bacterium]|nr:molybdenum ABC transporter ATP-binding protein [Gammaproteobacteria bacterium]
MGNSIDVLFKLVKGDFLLDVDFTIPAKGVTALFGPSGCGKTTLLRAIAGLERSQIGQLTVAGNTWQNANHFIAPHQRPIGYVFQEASLFEHLSIQQNLEYGLKRVAADKRKVSLEQAIELLGIAPLLKRNTYSLSGGERQRVAIARALAVSPELLLMDEPLAALDQKRKNDVLPYIEKLRKELDIPVIYVSHSLEEVAQLADYLVLMQSGQVQSYGDIHDLFTRLDLPLAHELDASAIIHAEVIGFDETYHLTHLSFAAGTISVASQGLKLGDKVRLRLMARDVSLTLEHQKGTSILNIFPATVEELIDVGEAQVTVRLLAGDVPMLSKITRKSAADLNLSKGKSVFAQVKSVALLS